MEVNKILNIATRLIANEKPSDKTNKAYEKAYYHPLKDKLIEIAKKYMNSSAETDINKKEVKGELSALEKQLKSVWTEISAE